MASATKDQAGKGETAASGKRAFSPHAIHLLRTAQVNNLALSQMADQKASILMGATFVVFSLVVSRTLVGDPPLSLLVLGAFSVAASICAVAAVIPSTGPRRVLPKEGANRLFFGHFALMDEDAWIDEMLREFANDESLFRLALHDIHQHGAVLYRRKYRFLGWAYRLFVAGLALTVLAFAWESF